MNLVDVIVIAILTYFVYRGAQAGMVNELSGFTSWIVAGFLALIFGARIGASVIGLIPKIPEYLASIVGFVVLLVGVRFAVKFSAAVLKKLMGENLHNSLSRFLGAVIGFFKGVILISLLILVLKFVPVGEKVDYYRQNSVLYVPLSEIAQVLIDTVVKYVPGPKMPPDQEKSPGDEKIISVG